MLQRAIDALAPLPVHFVATTGGIEQWKVGRALPGDADPTQIRTAAEDVLGNPIFRDEAAKRALAFSGIDGAELAASSIERVMRGA